MKRVLLIVAALFFAMPDMQAKGDDEEVKIVLVKEDNSDNYYYEGVVPVEGITKEEMFKRAKEWVLSNLKTEDNNAQFDEKEFSIYNTPTILVKAAPKYKDDYVNFKLKLLFKDGKYKFRIDNLIVKSNFSIYATQAPVSYNDKKMFPGNGVGYNRGLIENINIYFYSISSSLENAIKGNNVKKDDW
jgi:hypothetical protein